MVVPCNVGAHVCTISFCQAGAHKKGMASDAKKEIQAGHKQKGMASDAKKEAKSRAKEVQALLGSFMWHVQLAPCYHDIMQAKSRAKEVQALP
eukprot:2532997-Amphidinium_carterae.1